MASLVEFHGHLTRGDGRPVGAGLHDLRFDLYPAATGDGSLWHEVIAGARVGAEGECHVLLGRAHPLAAELFDDGPRWLAVREARDSAPELGARVPISGQVLRLSAALAELEDRVTHLERAAHRVAAPDPRAARRVRLLHRRLKRIESGRGALEPVHATVDGLRARVERLDGDEGRLTRIEDELEDLVGPDGDLIDLLERVEKLEGTSPVPKPAPGPVPRMDPRFLAQLAERVEALGRRLAEVEGRKVEAPSAESLNVVRRGGDVMTGGLTINRGGLDVLSGGIKSRGAEVNTLEASIHVKAPKVLADAIELRGDLTVDSARRVVQVRHVEGRSGSARKDGPLLLNARSGEPVEVGNAERHAGMRVHGALAADGVDVGGALVARMAGEEAAPGEVCVAGPRGVARSAGPAQAGVVGVCVEAGAGGPRVAFAGVTRCLVVGEVAPGDLLVTSAEPGRACRAEGPPAPGTVLGRALSAASGPSGEVTVLVSLG